MMTTYHNLLISPGQAEQRPVKGVDTAGWVQEWAVPGKW